MSSWVATSNAHSWGAAYSKEKAINNAIQSARTKGLEADDMVEVAIFEVEGDWTVDGYRGGVRADEILQEEKQRLDVKTIKAIQGLQDEILKEKVSNMEVIEK